jgi:FkbM family methyltransferase
VFETLPCELSLVQRGAMWRDRAALLRILARLHLQAGLVARTGRFLRMGAVREVDVRIRGIGSLRLRTNDLPVFEVLGCEAYGVDLSLLDGVDNVLDLGANVGLASVYFARRLPGVAIWAVEPSPASFRLLRENLRRNAPSATAVRAAVVAESRPLRVVEGSYGGVTTVALPADRSGTPVEGLALPDLFDRIDVEQVDLMKIDVQGAEVDLFATAKSWADRVRAIIAEVHAPLTVDAAAAALAPHGFEPLPLPPGRLFDDMLYVRR